MPTTNMQVIQPTSETCSLELAATCKAGKQQMVAHAMHLYSKAVVYVKAQPGVV